MKNLHIMVEGRVQGVGYRYFVRSKAFKYNIRGTVQNTKDKKVEIYCQGEDDRIEMFIMELYKGPPLAMILKMDINNSINEEFSDFRIM
ncbi:acylphosphatase [Candidatus Woesearchaeota archaeon]|nr:acylphosphatase [Candidatus Woesearchaeota archaeon]